ncbi:hypothetical protein [Cohnella sp. JJ-181]|uniref:hypothetical protein n=1 Tax=Cohnella rhizoplanae TaxID=2974897 RepID=UPI0022FF6B33|nr:hypothetical protein [Cohnella sp. JJ-181]CAI6040897.1 hypothetical protein COHCIP112018_01083 [Cohnella sp. JJ-181]
MRIRLQEERGSALLLVVFMILLFTMLGFAIMGAMLGGAQRSETREKDVQGLHLAEMALNEAASEVLDYLEDERNQDISIDELRGKLDEIEGKLTELKGKTTSGDVGQSAIGSIHSISVDKEGKVKNQFNISSKEYTITIEAEAVVDGVKRMLAQDIVLDSYPDFLKYAMGSEGNVYLNGASYIRGNLYAGKKLWVKNEADYRYHLAATVPDLNEPTVFPRIGGSVYVQPGTLGNGASIQACEQRPCQGRYDDVDPDKPGGGDKVEKYFGITADDIKLKDQNKFVTVNVKESFYDKVAEAAGISRSLLSVSGGMTPEAIVEQARTISSASFLALDEPTAPAADATPDEKAAYNDQKNKIISSLNGTLANSVIYRMENGSRASLMIDGAPYASLAYTEDAKNDLDMIGELRKTNWFIVEGDLTIDASRTGSPIDVRGNILVTGDLRIKGNVRMDATVIALGSATIEDATISGLNGKELVLISEGDLLINRVDPFNTISNAYPGVASAQDPGVLEAFLYTDKKATLYGVGSAFWIKGGLFAKDDITINAVLGNTSASGNSLSFDPVMNANEDADRGFSRFIVEYNSDVYVDQKIGLPRVQQINLTVGPKRFAD